MADRAEQDGVVAEQLLDRRVRQNLARTQVPVAAEIVLDLLDFEAESIRRRIEDFHGLTRDFGARSITWDYSDPVQGSAS